MESLVGKYGAVLHALPLDEEDAKWVAGGNGIIGHAGIIGKVIEDDGEIIKFYNPQRTMRFWKKGFKEFPSPALTWGDRVYVDAKKEEAVVYAIAWHYKDQEYFYFLQYANGRKSTKRYYIQELKKL